MTGKRATLWRASGERGSVIYTKDLAWKKPKSNMINVSAYPVLSRKLVRPDIKASCRYHSGNTLCGRTGLQHSGAPPRTHASCTHNTHHPSSGGIPSARNSGKEKGKKCQNWISLVRYLEGCPDCRLLWERSCWTDYLTSDVLHTLTQKGITEILTC